MKQKRGKKRGSRAVLPVMFLITLIVVLVGGFGLVGNAEAQFTITSCTDCHGSPPADGIARDNPAGAVIGSHVKHVTDQGIACTVCHIDNGADLAHRSGNIDMANPIHSGTGDYSKPDSFPQVNNPTMGTCSNIYCHSNVQATNGTAAANVFDTPTWGGTVNCDDCHGQAAETDGQPATGSHDTHAAASGMNYACDTCHDNGGSNGNHADDTINMDIDDTYGASAEYLQGVQGDHSPGSGGYANCSTTYCHGTGSDNWGTDKSASDNCTICHGNETVGADKSAAAYKRAPGADGTGVDTNGDAPATDAQVGAHQAHMTLGYGYTDALNSGGNCNECHKVPSTVSEVGHFDSALPAEVFPGTINPEKADLVSVTPDYTGGSCTVYCHGATLTGGSDTTPAWNDDTLLIGTRTAAADCGVCHASPPAISPHVGDEAINECITCHTHVDTDGSFLDASLHINGVINASGNCDSCHSYRPDPADGKAYMEVNNSAPAANEGKGAHIKHVNHIEALYVAGGGSALDAANDSFGNATTTAICGVCHDMNAANHDTDGNGTRLINFNGSTAYQFGAAGPAYGGVPGTSGLGAGPDKTCSNVSCHFQASPEWQSY